MPHFTAGCGVGGASLLPPLCPLTPGPALKGVQAFQFQVGEKLLKSARNGCPLGSETVRTGEGHTVPGFDS